MLSLLKVFTVKVKVLLAILMTVVIITLKVIQLYIEWWIDSVYLAKCIYNKGCDAETVLQDIPAFIQPYGQLKVFSFSSCQYIHQKWWTSIFVTTHCDDYIFDLEIVGYPYLESFTIFSTSSSSSFFEYTPLFRLEGMIKLIFANQISHPSSCSI